MKYKYQIVVDVGKPDVYYADNERELKEVLTKIYDNYFLDSEYQGEGVEVQIFDEEGDDIINNDFINRIIIEIMQEKGDYKNCKNRKKGKIDELKKELMGV